MFHPVGFHGGTKGVPFEADGGATQWKWFDIGGNARFEALTFSRIGRSTEDLCGTL